jgi:hypothetical protein
MHLYFLRQMASVWTNLHRILFPHSR